MFKNISVKKIRIISAIKSFLLKRNFRNLNNKSNNEEFISKENLSTMPKPEKHYHLEYKYHVDGKWYKQTTILSTTDESIVKNENEIIQLIKKWDFCFAKNKPVLIEIIEIRGPGKLADMST